MESGTPGRGSALLLEGKGGVRGRFRGTLSSREARTPGSARQGPPAPRPSQPESDDPSAEQPQQPRASPRGRLPRPLQRERRTPLARTRPPARPPECGGIGNGGGGREWTDRRMDEADRGRMETSTQISHPRGSRGWWRWGELKGAGLHVKEAGPAGLEAEPYGQWAEFNGDGWGLGVRGVAYFWVWAWFKAEKEEPVGKGAELAWGPGSLEIGRRREGVLEEAINLESGPIRDANPLVPPPQPHPPLLRSSAPNWF